MKINMKDIVAEKTEFSFTVPISEFQFSEQEAVLKEDVQVGVTLEKVRREVLLRGTMKTLLELECSRCLEHFSFPVSEDFQTILQPFSPSVTEEEVELAKEDLDIIIYQDDIIDLTEILREQILLSIPMISVCDPSCQGLCPQCGQNLNQKKCSCVQNTIDPRWHKLQDLAKKKQ
ncbi:MAG: DUF177 domain-containing protein [bacterium]